MQDAEWHFRTQWANYFDQQHVQYAFYSAANATAIQQARREAAGGSEALFSSDESDSEVDRDTSGEYSEVDDEIYFSAEEDREDRDPRAKILSVVELEEMFLKTAPDLSSKYLRRCNTA